MKTILSLGHTDYLLPAKCNVNALLAILSEIKEVRYDWKGDSKTYVVQPDARKIEITLVEDHKVTEPPKRKSIPEKASPDAHNTF